MPAGQVIKVSDRAVRPADGPPQAVLPRSGWPARRTPRLALLAGAVIIAGVVLVALPHRPSTAERAADLRAFTSDMQADIGSCAADVGASMIALRAIETGASRDVATARTIAASGASDCSPANDELLANLVQYQVPGSLASFRLNRVVRGLVAWAAPDAERVQADAVRVLSVHGRSAQASARAALARALAALDAQRAAADSVIASASRALSARATPPRLPG